VVVTAVLFCALVKNVVDKPDGCHPAEHHVDQRHHAAQRV
jgi:hypothetical protein